MGVIAPILCIALQPVLPSGLVEEVPGLRFLNAFPFLNYGVVALNTVAMATWLGLGCRVGKWGGVVAGILFTGTVFAGLLGLVLLPFSLIGLVVVVGALAFTPLFTSYVFFRNGVRAFRLGSDRTSPFPRWVHPSCSARRWCLYPGSLTDGVRRLAKIDCPFLRL